MTDDRIELSCRDQPDGLDSLDGFYKYDPSGGEDFPVRARPRKKAEPVIDLGTRRLIADRRIELGLKNLRTFDGDINLHIGFGEVVVRDGDGRVAHRFETKDLVAGQAATGPASRR